MRLRRLLVVVAATATVAVISLGPVPASVGALVDPATPSVSNIPAGPVYGTSFVSTVSTNSDGSPFVTSGLRLGTAAETTAGMGPAEMAQVAALLARTLRNRADEQAVAAIRAEVAELCAAFAPYPGLAGGVPAGR